MVNDANKCKRELLHFENFRFCKFGPSIFIGKFSSGTVIEISLLEIMSGIVFLLLVLALEPLVSFFAVKIKASMLLSTREY